jgi:hypothetical protein
MAARGLDPPGPKPSTPWTNMSIHSMARLRDRWSGLGERGRVGRLTVRPDLLQG